MTAIVERSDAADNWYEFSACIRGPGIQEVEAQVRALLGSVRFDEVA